MVSLFETVPLWRIVMKTTDYAHDTVHLSGQYLSCDNSVLHRAGWLSEIFVGIDCDKVISIERDGFLLREKSAE